MFLEKKYDSGDVVSLKLTSGEEVIGRFVKEDITSITLEKPSMIAMTPKGPGMAPVMFTVNPESHLTFNKSAVMITAPSHKDIADQYMFQTTGIQPVRAGSIVTG